MKTKRLLSVFCIALGIVVIALLYKILHWPGANIMLIVSMSTMSLMLILLGIKIGNSPSGDDFWNS